MAELVSMKRTKEEKSKEGSDMAVSVDEQDDFPWGLRVDLRDEDIEKLGLSMPAVGSEATFTARVKVISVRESADKEGKNRNIEYQITDLSIDPSVKRSDKERANILFGGD